MEDDVRTDGARARGPIHVEDYDWTETFSGVRTAVLSEDLGAGIRHELVWAERGAAVPRHVHMATEDVLVLAGTLVVQGENEGRHGPGAVFRSRVGTEHEAVAGDAGDCVCFVVVYFEPLTD